MGLDDFHPQPRRSSFLSQEPWPPAILSEALLVAICLRKRNTMDCSRTWKNSTFMIVAEIGSSRATTFHIHPTRSTETQENSHSQNVWSGQRGGSRYHQETGAEVLTFCSTRMSIPPITPATMESQTSRLDISILFRPVTGPYNALERVRPVSLPLRPFSRHLCHWTSISTTR